MKAIVVVKVQLEFDMSSSPSPKTKTKTKTKRRILVVDDESDITFTLKKGLENSGMFEVDTFNDP